ncbi:7TM GPCR protein, partial [Aphelenchoides avenae]
MWSLPAIHHFLDSTVHLIAIVLNLGLLFVIHKHSQSVLKHYRTVMTITCVNDLLLSLVSFLTQPIIFLHDGLGIFISNGPMSGVDRNVLLWLQTAYCAVVHVNIAFLPVAFVYRYFNLC